jgi:hypothetical protein
MALAVEQHPQFQQILDWIAAGKDCESIAGKLQPPLHSTTIWRYKRNKLQAAMQGPASVISDLAAKGLLRQDIQPAQALQAAVSAGAAALAADPLISRIQQHRAIVDAKISEAGAQGAASLISADLKGLELEARLTGRLDSTAGAQSLTVVCGDIHVHQADAPREPGVTIDLTAQK